MARVGGKEALIGDFPKKYGCRKAGRKWAGFLLRAKLGATSLDLFIGICSFNLAKAAISSMIRGIQL